MAGDGRRQMLAELTRDNNKGPIDFLIGVVHRTMETWDSGMWTDVSLLSPFLAAIAGYRRAMAAAGLPTSCHWVFDS
jgi:hypothetical protein